MEGGAMLSLVAYFFEFCVGIYACLTPLPKAADGRQLASAVRTRLILVSALALVGLSFPVIFLVRFPPPHVADISSFYLAQFIIAPLIPLFVLHRSKRL